MLLWCYRNLLPLRSCALTLVYFFGLDLLPLTFNLVWIPGTLSIWSLFSVSSHSIWKCRWWPQAVHLDYMPCLFLSCSSGVIRLGARHLSLELQYLRFLTSRVWVCACQTFTVFKVFPVGLLILTFMGRPQLAPWQFPILSRHERSPPFPVTAFGKSNITLAANSQGYLQWVLAK